MIPLRVILFLITAIWAVVVYELLVPVFTMPIARIKREFAMTISVIGTIFLGVLWVSYSRVHLVSLLSFVGYLVFASIISHFLRKLDYYLDDLLQELFALTIASAAIGLVTSTWYLGLFVGVNSLILRLIVCSIPLIAFVVVWAVGRQKYTVWGIAVYVVLLLIKWIMFQYWGVWTIVILLLYATLVGYVINWMMLTTYAEKVLAWNVSPSKVWAFLVLSAGLLVLFF